ncbi:MAG: HD domain-containing protein [Candidatus Omnitrophica bacterium]|nr:HD domain-containing protein [Candidatus Omnitrophota bacterium]MBU4333736.1 HD domain-containing protein [Candidatus Omnitrophota bacterium]
MIIAQTATLSIDGDLLMKIPLNRQGVNSEAFKIILKKLQKIKKVDPILKYVYTMTQTDKPGVLQFIVDADTDMDESKDGEIVSFPGDKYDASRFSEMMKAFDGPAADKKMGTDEWGVLLSGYAPIYDSKGKAVAIIGVDINADDVYAVQKGFHQREIVILILGIILSLIVGTLFSNTIMQRIKKLAEGTQRIREGDFKHQVRVGGRDEISELAHDFNIMAKSLFLSNKKTHKYFYRAMQSLIRVLEAKDAYTAGHSDRVAEYAEKIALKMELPEAEVDLIKDSSRLHDIGKLGIQKTILNKKDRLTDEEWNVIREHPVLGEEILKPVVFDKQMLAVVRYHHERYDGTGYPDKLKGDEINRLASIISVADAYDAMTSDRAYRKGLNKKEALVELEKGKGKQFDPKVSDIFIQLLREEDIQTK